MTVMTYMQLEAASYAQSCLLGGVATYVSMASTTKHTAMDIDILIRDNIPASACCLGLPVSPLLLVRSKPSALCSSPLGMLPSLPLVAPPSSEGPPVPSVRVLTISRTKDGMSPLVSGSELLDAVPSGAIFVVLSLHSWPCRARLRPMASVALAVTVRSEVVSELVPSLLVLGDTRHTDAVLFFPLGIVIDNSPIQLQNLPDIIQQLEHVLVSR